MKKDLACSIAILSSSVHVLDVVTASSGAGFLHNSPGSAATAAVLCLAFAVVFLVLIYLKYCHRIPDDPLDRIGYNALNDSTTPCSGFDRSVIDSLPIFKFSSLKGSKQGLECAVCMSAFQDPELLRLLPKCKHAFHSNCIDRWLENSPTCPLCRYEYDARELSVSDDSHGQDFLRSSSNSLRETDVDIYIEREENLRWSRRFGPGNWNKYFDRSRKANHPTRQKDDARWNQNMLHRFNHRIAVRSLVVKQRWSDLNSLDLLFLSSEMLGASSSELLTKVDMTCEDLDRVSDVSKDGIDIARPSNVSDGRRSVSEITGLSRFANGSGPRHHESTSNRSGECTEETRTGRLWLPIVHRTINWLAGRERLGKQQIAGQC